MMYLALIHTALRWLKNPLVVAVLGLAVAQGYGAYKAHQGAARATVTCNARWESGIALAKQKEAERLRRIREEADRRATEAENKMRAVRQLARQIEEGLANAPDCTLDPATVDRLRRIK